MITSNEGLDGGLRMFGLLLGAVAVMTPPLTRGEGRGSPDCLHKMTITPDSGDTAGIDGQEATPS